LIAPARAWIAVDVERRTVKRKAGAWDGVLAGLRELDIVDQRLVGREITVREFDRDDRGVTRPVVDVVLIHVRKAVFKRG
jgi:hypothetical protein